ncbi:hypothetical protein F5884DRAFT_807899 [Xylogone sp. PMI_703]|nr:hypothetical protein F5884DRAFT_807899 [Xylogone sp. PMI_703]
MKFTLLAPLALFTLAAAQSTTTSASLSPQASCAAKCSKTDICCTAACFKVPCPNQSMANDTNKCVAACPQGSGTPADASAYASCEQSCFTSHFFPATTPTAAVTTPTGNAGSSATTTASGSGSAATGSNASGSGSPTASGSGSPTSSGSGAGQTNAANRAEIAVSAAGLFGVLFAALAL